MPLLFLVMVGADWGWWGRQPPIITSVWANYETVMQDNLTNNVGRGFKLDFTDAAWTQGLSNLNSDGQFNWIFSYDANGETAAHFPAVPYLMFAGEFFLSNREFVIVTLAGLLLALSLALLLNQVRLQFRWPTCLIAMLILIADGVIFQSTLFRAGDALITTIIILAFLVFVQGVNSVSVSRRSIWTWPVAGALLGATALFQAATNFWLFGILLIWIGYGTVQVARRKPWGLPPEAFVLFWIGVFVVAAPWWIRNCKTTGDFRPLGHAVGMNLVGAYCEQSALDSGNLSVDTIVRLRERELAAANFTDAELVEKEAYLSKLGVSTATQWVADHPSELPRLIIGRVGNHFGWTQHRTPQQIAFNAVVLLGALAGCLFSWQRWGGIILMLIVISTLVTAATWSDFGRQLIPLRPLIDVAFAIGVVRLIGLLNIRERSQITAPNSMG